jgi:hypothetical protein
MGSSIGSSECSIKHGEGLSGSHVLSSELEGRSRVEVENGGVEQRIVEDCKRSMRAAGCELLQSKPQLESPQCLDILQMSSQDAAGIGGEDLRRAVDCFDLEAPVKAAGSAKKKPISAKRWVEYLLGFFGAWDESLGLGRVIAGVLKGLLEGLDGLPFRKRIQLVLKGIIGHKPAGRLQGFRRPTFKLRLARKPFGFGRCKSSNSDSSSCVCRCRVETLSLQESEACGDAHGFTDSVCGSGYSDEGSDKPFSVDSTVCDRGFIAEGSSKAFSVDVSEGAGAGVEDPVDLPVIEAFHVKAAGDGFCAGGGIGASDGSVDVAKRRDHEVGLVQATSSCRDHELTSGMEVDLPMPPLVSDAGLESLEFGSGSVPSVGLVPELDVGRSLALDTITSVSDLVPNPEVVLFPEVSESDRTTGLVSGHVTSVESPTVTSRSLGFGLSKSQIWLLEWIKDRLKSHEEVKDEDHSVFLKDMEEDFRVINLVAREEGRLMVDEEDIRWLCMVAGKEGRWEVDEEKDDQKVAWMKENKEKISLSTEWPGPGGKIIIL